jgi:hypothetical protein
MINEINDNHQIDKEEIIEDIQQKNRKEIERLTKEI